MPVELNGLRMALDLYDEAEDAAKPSARYKLMALLTPGIVRVLLAALDDPDRLNDDPQE